MKNYTRFVIISCLCLILSPAVFAQETSSSLTSALSADQIKTIRDALKPKADELAQALVNNPDHPIDYAAFVQGYLKPQIANTLTTPLHLDLAKKTFSTGADTSRTDKQMGAAFASSGSTSVVDQPGIANLLGIAIEHGAITQDITGNTLTLSSSPYALIASAKGDTAEIYRQYADTYGRLGVSASFNLTDTANPLTNVTRKQLNEWSAKLRLLGDHSGRSKGAMTAFANHLQQPLQNMANSRAQIISTTLASDSGFMQKITSEANNRVHAFLADPANTTVSNEAKQEAISKILLDVFFLHVSELKMPTSEQLGKSLEAFDQAARDYAVNSADFEQALKELMQKPTLSLVYNQQHPTTGSSYSVVKLVYGQQASTLLQLTANIEGSFYHHPDPTKNQETFRGINGALDFLNKLGKSPFVRDSADKSTITLSFSGRYERLRENRGMPGKKADIAVASAKLEIPVAAGISFPISATYANATELIKEAHVQGNFGFTFDLDKLSALIHK